MKTFTKYSLLVIFLNIVILNCSNVIITPPLVNNKVQEIQVVKGDKIGISLKSNPSTGYMWSLLNNSNSSLLVFDSQETKVDNEKVFGSPVKQIFYFNSNETGNSIISFELKMYGTEIIKTIIFNISVVEKETLEFLN